MRKSMIFLLTFCLFAPVFGISNAADQKTPYVIGVAADLSGPAAFLGQPGERVIRMMADEINASGGINGRQLKVVSLDNESRPDKAVLNTKNLIGNEKALVLTGYNTSGSTMANIETVQASQVPLLSTGASENIWIPTKKWVFNVVPRHKEACTPQLMEYLKARGAKKIAYLYVDSAYGESASAAFKWYVEKEKISPALIEKYDAKATDFSPQITHVKTSGADGLFIDGLAGDSAKVLKTARDLGFKGPIAVGYGVVGPEFIKLLGKYGENVTSTSLKALVADDLPASDPQKAIAMDLNTKYTKQYGTFSLYGGHGWDAMNLIAAALKKCDPNLDPSDDADVAQLRAMLRDNLEALKNINGQNGIFNYSPDNHNGLPPGCYVTVIIEDGQWRLYDAVK